MKKIILLILFAFSFACTDAQSSGWIWARTAVSDGGNYAIRSCADHSGNTYVSGYFVTDTIYFGTNMFVHTGNYGSDIFLTKYDAAGNVLWAKNFPSGRSSGNNDDEHELATDAAGNIYFTAVFYLDTAVYGNYTLINDSVNGLNNVSDVAVVKCGPSGNVLWAKRMGGSFNELTAGICVDNNNNVFVTGYYYSDSIFFGNDTILHSNFPTMYAYPDIFILKYDSLGNELWAKRAFGNLTDMPKSIAADSSGNIYLTGFFDSDGLQFDNLILNNTTGIFDFFIAKYDGNGNAVWAKKATGSGEDFGFDLTVDRAGDIIATGKFESAAITFDNLTLVNTPGFGHAFLVKYNSSGNAVWAKNSISLFENWGTGVITDATNAIFLTGRFDSSYVVFGNDTCYNNGTSHTGDLFVTKYDAAGNELWAISTTGNGDDQGNSISIDSYGDVYVAGFYWGNLTLGNINISQAGPSGSELFLAKLGVATGMQELSAHGSFLIYPNPANDILHLTIYNFDADQLTISVFDVAGRSVLAKNSVNDHTDAVNTTLNIGSLSSGVYFVRVEGEGRSAVAKFVKDGNGAKNGWWIFR